LLSLGFDVTKVDLLAITPVGRTVTVAPHAGSSETCNG
jgi:hypothetical protein